MQPVDKGEYACQVRLIMMIIVDDGGDDDYDKDEDKDVKEHGHGKKALKKEPVRHWAYWK